MSMLEESSTYQAIFQRGYEEGWREGFLDGRRIALIERLRKRFCFLPVELELQLLEVNNLSWIEEAIKQAQHLHSLNELRPEA